MTSSVMRRDAVPYAKLRDAIETELGSTFDMDSEAMFLLRQNLEWTDQQIRTALQFMHRAGGIAVIGRTPKKRYRLVEVVKAPESVA